MIWSIFIENYNYGVVVSACFNDKMIKIKLVPVDTRMRNQRVLL